MGKWVVVVAVFVAASIAYSAVPGLAQVSCTTGVHGGVICSDGDYSCIADESSVNCGKDPDTVHLKVPKTRQTHAWRTCEDVKADIISPVAPDPGGARIKVILATVCGTARHPHTAYVVVDTDV